MSDMKQELDADELGNVIVGLRARITKLEGARAKAEDELKDEEERHQGTLGLLAGAYAEVLKQAAELARLRTLVNHIRALAPNGTRGLGSIALDVFKAVDEFVRAPAAQAEPQTSGEEPKGNDR